MNTTIEKFKKPVLIFTGVLLVYALLGYLVLPLVIEAKLPELVAQQTGKKTTLTEVKFDPFSFQLSIKGLELQEPDQQKIIRLEEIYVNLGIWSSIKYQALAIDKVYLDRPSIDIVRKPDGSLNLAELAGAETAQEAEPAVEEKPFPLWLGLVKINKGSLHFSDLSLPEPYAKQITDLNLKIAQLATVALEDHVDDTLSLAFADGGAITWQGDIELTPFVTTAGHLEITEFNSEILWEYIKHQLGFDIAQGKWNLQTDYAFSMPEQQTHLALSNSHVTLTNALNEGGFLEWQGQVDVLPQTHSTGQLTITDLSVQKLWQFVPEDVAFKLEQGNMDLASEYTFSMTEAAEPEMQLDLANSKITLTDVLDDGDSIVWQGDSKVMPDIKSSGNLAINHLNLHKIWLQTQAQFDLKIKQGTLNFNSDYLFQQLQGEEEPQLQLSKGHIDGNNIALSAKDADLSLVSVASVAIDELALDLLKRQVNIQSIKTDNGSILTIINEQGEVNLAAAFTGKTVGKVAEEAQQAIPEATANPWLVNIASIRLQKYLVDFTQQTASKPVKLKLSPINISINDFTTAAKKPFQLKSDITVNKSGKITAQGKVSLEPMDLAIAVNASALSLRPFQPYLDQSTRLELIRGQLALKSKLDFKQTKAGKTALKVSGNVNINRLKTVEVNNHKDFLSWKTVALQQFKFSLDPLKLAIATVNIEEIDTKVIINQDKSTNLEYIFSAPKKAKPAKQKAPKTVAKKDKPLALDIKTIKVKDSAAFYADRSLMLPFAADISQLNGSINNVSSRKETRSKIHLQGKANQTAPVLIQGDVEPFAFENHLNILLQVDNMNMTGITPYMAEFAGYKVEKGKLSVNLLYKIKDKQLQADNRVVINQLTLGDTVDSPNSVSIPVKLGIGLLKNKDGVIDIDLPVQGNLDDPEFSVLGVLGDVLLNLLSKTVTAPFSVMSSLLNTDADLSKVVFSAGSAELNEEQKQTLDALSEGLLQRPQLQLEVRGLAYKTEDGKGLGETAIRKKIQAVAWRDLYSYQRPEDIADTQVSEEDYQEILSDLYKEKFQDQAEVLIDKAEDAPDPAAAKVFYDHMLDQLARTNSATNPELNQLAKQRAAVISNYLVDQKQIPAHQVYILGQSIREQAENNEVVVELNLGVND